MTPTMSPFSFTVWPVDSNKVNKAAYSLGPGLQILRWQMLLSFFLRVKTFRNTVLLPVELAMFYHRLSPELINSPAPRDLDYLPVVTYVWVRCVWMCGEVTGQPCKAGFLHPSFCASWESNSSHQACSAGVFTRWAISFFFTSLLVCKAAAVFLRIPFPTWFWVGVDYEENLYTTGKAEMKQQRLPSEGHLVSRTDKHRALSASPGCPAPNSRPGAYIALRWRAPALSNYNNIIWCREKGVEAGVGKKNFMNFLKIKVTL